jgi:hypothetical protein
VERLVSSVEAALPASRGRRRSERGDVGGGVRPEPYQLHGARRAATDKGGRPTAARIRAKAADAAEKAADAAMDALLSRVDRLRNRGPEP